jgi:hypothetical protein
VVVVVRPEDVRLCDRAPRPGVNVLEGRVETVVFIGGGSGLSCGRWSPTDPN